MAQISGESPGMYETGIFTTNLKAQDPFPQRYDLWKKTCGYDYTRNKFGIVFLGIFLLGSYFQRNLHTLAAEYLGMKLVKSTYFKTSLFLNLNVQIFSGHFGGHYPY